MANLGDMIRAQYSVDAHNETLGGLVMQYERGEFDLDAPYQRGHVWTLAQKQLLIDSFLTGLGIPPIILIDHDDNRDAWREVVDGKQRMTALMEFVQDRYPVAGVWWHDLDEASRRKMRNTGISIYRIHDLTTEQAWEVFRRVNFCGVAQDELAFEQRKAATTQDSRDTRGEAAGGTNP